MQKKNECGCKLTLGYTRFSIHFLVFREQIPQAAKIAPFTVHYQCFRDQRLSKIFYNGIFLLKHLRVTSVCRFS